jgi:hypothetical protein
MKKQILMPLFTLLIGSFIYISFRQDTLILFDWLREIGVFEFIAGYRHYTLPFADNIPDWILYSLPDGLWLFSYISFALIIWDNKISKYSFFWIIIVPIIAICSEIGQLFNIIPGTYDLVDIFIYVIFYILAVQIFYKPSNYEY